MVKGIILAAGNGHRFFNKPSIYGKPFAQVNGTILLEYPVQSLREAGVRDIVIGVNEHDYEIGLRFGRIHGVEIKVSATKGTAGCLKDCISPEVQKGVVLFGDTVYFQTIATCVDAVMNARVGTAVVGVKKTPHLAEYMAIVPSDGKYVAQIKPHPYQTGLAYVGIFCFNDPKIAERIAQLSVSKRGELELTDLITLYAKEKLLSVAKYEGELIDCNTPAGMYQIMQYSFGRKDEAVPLISV